MRRGQSKPGKKKGGNTSLFGFHKEEVRCLIVGLDASGKTMLLYQEKLGEAVTTIPTIGFNVEDIELQGTKYTMWDVGGQPKIRPLWRHYLQNTQAIIWVVDATDSSNFGESATELEKVLQEEEVRDVPILVVLSKAGLPGAHPTDSILSAFSTALEGRKYLVVRYFLLGQSGSMAGETDTTSIMPFLQKLVGMKQMEAYCNVTEEVAVDRIALRHWQVMNAASTLLEKAKAPVSVVDDVMPVLFGNLSVPVEVIGVIFGFVDFEDLLPVPHFHLKLRKGRSSPWAVGGPWLTCRTFLYSAWNELSLRMTGEFFSIKAFHIKEALLERACRPLVYFQPPEGLVPIQVAISALLVLSLGPMFLPSLAPRFHMTSCPLVTVTNRPQVAVAPLLMGIALLRKRPELVLSFQDGTLLEEMMRLFSHGMEREMPIPMLDLMTRVGKQFFSVCSVLLQNEQDYLDGGDDEGPTFFPALRITPKMLFFDDIVFDLIRSGRYLQLELEEKDPLPMQCCEAALDVLTGDSCVGGECPCAEFSFSLTHLHGFINMLFEELPRAHKNVTSVTIDVDRSAIDGKGLLQRLVAEHAEKFSERFPSIELHDLTLKLQA